MKTAAAVLAFFVLAVFLHSADSQMADQSVVRLCGSQTVCADCITIDPRCVWCADVNFTGPSRCYPSGDSELAAQCTSGMAQNPQGAASNPNNVPLEGLTQISPASISVSARPGAPVTFPLNVRPANNFPIDLYLLMDLSFSMRDDLVNLQGLGSLLAERIGIISTNFQLGFGSFVDKRLAPYVNLSPNIFNNPCFGDPGFPNGCEATYSYRHSISLTPSAMDFDAGVQAQVISGNQDSPEGGFDGFLQAIVCTELIGWRDVSRKIILFITDAGFHFAGDGKLGGVVKPHDGECKITTPSGSTSVDYEEWDTLDYPSVGQIAQSLRENDIIPIFAAEASALPIYEALAAEIGSAFTGPLAADSNNIVDLVESRYNEIAQRIEFDPEPVPGVTFGFTPTVCPGSTDSDGNCVGVQINQTASFEVALTLQECTPEITGQTIRVPVRVVGFGSFEVDVTPICTCPCEGEVIDNSIECSGNGTQVCGICECNEGFFGDQCQCDASGLQNGTQITCPVGPNGVECTSSDRGSCICGVCNCRDGIQGVACECDDSFCDRGSADGGQDLLCSGRGDCTCTGCNCGVVPMTTMNYFGSACECTPVQDCTDPRNNTDICNGHGFCDSCAGTCVCTDEFFTGGFYCDRCSGSAEVCQSICTDNDDTCSECVLEILRRDEFTNLEVADFFSIALDSDAIPDNTTIQFNVDTNVNEMRFPVGFCDSCRFPIPIVLINQSIVDDMYRIRGQLADLCEHEFEGCVYRYFVLYNTSSDSDPEPLEIHIIYRACTLTRVAPYIIALSILIPLLVLGLLALLLLKVFLVILDVIEVRKFQQDLAKTKYSKNENPLYRSAQKEYANPIYGK